MPESARRPTAADVARLSGVSTATVSYVLNRTAGQTIPEATRERVLAAARTLGYVPNAPAQALARGSSRIVVVDLSELPHGVRAGEQARELAEGLEAAGYVAVVAPPGARVNAGHTLLLGLASAVVPFGVITVSPLPEDQSRRLTKTGVQRQLSLATPDDINTWIGRSAREQVRYLHAQGHGRIGFWGPGEPVLAQLGEVRRRAAEQESRDLGVAFSSLGSGTDADAITRAVRESKVTAVAAYNDEVAFGVLSALHSAGIPVPDGIAVIGVDDHPLAVFAIPPLTTVSHPLEDFGTVQTVIAHLESGQPLPGVERDYPPTVIVRGSA